MAFKIVGADENSDFPTRVETRLGTKFASKTHTHVSSNITDFNTAVDARVSVASVPDASETVKGKVELATTAETTAGTDTTRAVTPAGVKAVADTKANSSHTHTSADITNFSADVISAVPSATTTVQGKIEIATDAEAITGTDTLRAVTPANLAAVFATKPNLREDTTDPGFFIF